MSYEFSILYCINLYKKYWKPLVLIVILSVFLAAFSSLRKPPTYASTIRLLMKTGNEPVASRLDNLLGISTANSLDIITAIVTSRRMAQDINERFKLGENPKLWWRVHTYRVMAGMGIEIRGPDPRFAQKVAEFTIENIDKINSELKITTDDPMVKILDPATYGVRQSRGTLRKMIVAGMFSFLAFTLCLFFLDYFKKMKIS